MNDWMHILATGGAGMDLAGVDFASLGGVGVWWHRWLTLAMLGVMLVSLLRNLIPPDAVFMGGLVVVVAAGVITPEEAFHGLSNHGMITVGAMFVVAAGMRETGALHVLVSRLLGVETSPRAALARIVCPSAAISGFVNNTPIVAMLIPEIVTWCRKRNISPSSMLMPLSHATMLGGMCTLIGTSTLLVVSGIMRDNGMAPLGLFEPGYVGVPVALAGLTFIILFGQRLLPRRKELLEQLGEAQREYIVEMSVQPECPMVGDTVKAAGLRQLPGLFLIEIDRDGEITAPVGPNEVLQAGDRLVFTGIVRTIMDLQRIPGLVPAADKHYDVSREARRERRLCEAVVSGSFPELGKSIRNSGFRTRYDAVVVAVHRNGQRVNKKIGDVVLRPGDTLLIQAGPHFEQTFHGSTDFYLVSEVRDSAPVRHDKAWLAMLILLAVVGMLVGTNLSAAVATLIGAGLMVLTRCVPMSTARRAVDWQVLIVIAAALGFGEAVKKSGLASDVAGLMTEAASGAGGGGALATLVGIYVLVNVLTELITAKGAVAIVFPIAMTAAHTLSIDPRPFAVTIAIAAAAGFATPIGYQTNLMVYGPGGYRFGDFLRLGLPLKLITLVVAMWVIPRVWPF